MNPSMLFTFADFKPAFNTLDIIIIVIFAICILTGYRKGLVKMTFHLIAYILSVYIASKLYPLVSVILRSQEKFYGNLKLRIIESLNIGDIISENIQAGEAAVFEKLPLPDFLSNLLMESNRPNIYEMLNVSGLEDYIGGYLANIVINILSAVIVFALVAVGMRLLIIAVDLVSRLPVINGFNRLGGALAGSVFAVISVWIMLAVYTLFFVGVKPSANELLDTSVLAGYFYKNNILLVAFTSIFG